MGFSYLIVFVFYDRIFCLSSLSKFPLLPMLLLVAILRFYRWQFYFYLFIYFLRSFRKIVPCQSSSRHRIAQLMLVYVAL